MSGHGTALWRAVIVQAFEDGFAERTPSSLPGSRDAIYRRKSAATAVRRRRNMAQRWLLDDSDDFRHVCSMAGLDPDLVRTRAEEFQATGWRRPMVDAS